ADLPGRARRRRPGPAARRHGHGVVRPGLLHPHRDRTGQGLREGHGGDGRHRRPRLPRPQRGGRRGLLGGPAAADRRAVAESRDVRVPRRRRVGAARRGRLGHPGTGSDAHRACRDEPLVKEAAVLKLKHSTTLMTVAIVTATAAIAAIPPRPGPAAEALAPVTTVVPIDWTRFTSGRPTDEQAERSRAILLNANKYALTSWYPSRYGAQTGEYLDFGGTAEGNIRPPG